MALAAQSLERYRVAVFNFNVAIRNLTQAGRDIVDQGGATFINGAATAAGLEAGDITASWTAVVNVNASLDDDTKTDRKALLKVEA